MTYYQKGTGLMANHDSCLGVIETAGLSAALEASDTMLKSQKVTLLSIFFEGNGQIAVVIQGNTGMVQAAIEAGATAAERKGTVLARNVIPRCSQDVIDFLAHMSDRTTPIYLDSVNHNQ